MERYLLDSDDATSDPGAGVSCGQAVAESTPAQVIGVGVNDHGTAQDAVFARQRDDLVCEHDVGDTVVFGENVAQISGVAHFVVGATVIFLKPQQSLICKQQLGVGFC